MLEKLIVLDFGQDPAAQDGLDMADTCYSMVHLFKWYMPTSTSMYIQA